MTLPQHASLRGSVLAAKRAEAASSSLWEEAQAVRNHQVPLAILAKSKTPSHIGQTKTLL